jgi:DNA-binding SARP family transcriptional activator/ABC-type transport system substrate-binding protein/DNA-binding beta-propeller fold protein YncE
MEFTILGPIEAQVDGRRLALGGPKQRGVLAILLLHANEAVSRDQLIDGLWGDSPPPSARHTLDDYVSRLRRALGPDRIERRAPGFVLRVEPGELDLETFEALLENGRAAAAAGDAAEARDSLHAALALWRAPALADLEYEPFAGVEAARLEERRLLALEARVDADLQLGSGPELVGELERLVSEHPYRERLLGYLMVSLYRAGRQSEALAVYQAGRQRLAEELGLEPGAELQELERRILRHDPGLLATSGTGWGSRTPKHRWAVVFGLAVVGATAALAVVLGTGGTGVSIGYSGNQLVALRGLGAAPAALTAAYGHLWTANPDAGTVSRIDLPRGSVRDEIQVPGSPAALAAGGRWIWTSSVPGDRVERIDPQTDRVTKIVRLGSARAGAIAFGDGGLWIGDVTDNDLIEFDPVSGRPRRRIALSVKPTALAIGNGTIWVADYDENEVVPVDLKTGSELPSVHVGSGPSAVAIGAGAVWVANELDGTVTRIDLQNDSAGSSIGVGSWPSAVEVADGSVWVANRYSYPGTVARIDHPNGNAKVTKFHVGGEPVALAAARAKIWEASAPPEQHRGGTLRLLHTRPITIDPQQQSDLLPLQSDALTADGLVTYNHAPGSAGTQLVPDLALNMPEPTDGGTTYTFRLRPDIHYSNGRLVRASDFRLSIERLFSLRRPRAQERLYFTDIVGAEACERARVARCDLSRGIVTDNTAGTVRIELRTPDPSFLSDLANRPVPPIPPGTPFLAIGFRPIPGTGPYKIASANTHEIRYVRNPYFHEWSYAAQPDGSPDQIVTRFGLSPAAEVRAVEKGRADYVADPIPAKMLTTLRASTPQQLHQATIPTTAFYALNTRVPPFNDVRVRRALNFAVDRRLLVRLYGGPEQATPTCQILPPGIPGYRRYCPYTRDPSSGGRWTAPDLAKAKRLVAASGTRGTAVRVWDASDAGNPAVDRYLALVLRHLGYRASVRLVPQDAFFGRHPRLSQRMQLKSNAFGDTSYGYFAAWFSCHGQNDQAWFCDRRVASDNTRAASLNFTNPRAAQRVWSAMDRKLVDEAAWLPTVHLLGVDFVSARVRNYQFQPYSGVIADQLWLR